MFVITTIRILCEDNPSLGTAVVNGLLAWAGVLGGCTVLCSGLPAAVAVFIPGRPARFKADQPLAGIRLPRRRAPRRLDVLCLHC